MIFGLIGVALAFIYLWALCRNGPEPRETEINEAEPETQTSKVRPD